MLVRPVSNDPSRPADGWSNSSRRTSQEVKGVEASWDILPSSEDRIPVGITRGMLLHITGTLQVEALVERSQDRHVCRSKTRIRNRNRMQTTCSALG